MVKNKKIKKLFSVVCTVLTLNSTSSIFQHNLSAIQFETTNENGSIINTVTFDKPFRCIVVYDEPELTHKVKKNHWKDIPLVDFLFDNSIRNELCEVTTLRVSAQECIGTLKEFLNKVSDKDEVLIILCLTEEPKARVIPALPYSFMATTQLKSRKIVEALKTQLHDTTFNHLVFSLDDINRKLITLEPTKSKNAYGRICEYILKTTGRCVRTYNSIEKGYETRPAFWHLKEPGRIMNVRELKNWLATHNPDLLNQASRTTNTISHPSTNQTPRSNENHINPPPALHNDENKAHDNSDFTPAKDASFELDGSGMTLVTDLMNDAGCNEEIIPTETLISNQSLHEPGSYGYENKLRTNVFSKTKELIQNHPKTSVGLGAAVLALGGTVIYTLKQLFTRESKKSQANNQINQKYNQHVKNKI